MKSDEAMQVAQRMFDLRKDQGVKYKKIPQTKSQIAQVRRILG